MRKVFKIRQVFANNACPPIIAAVVVGGPIKTAADAEKHCLNFHHHKDEDDNIHKVIEAKAVRPEPFDESEAPQVTSLKKLVDTGAVKVVTQA